MGNAVETKQYPVKKSSRSPALIQPGAKELKQSLKKVEALMDKAPIGICHTDLTGKFTYVNKRFEEVSGYSREEVVGKNGFKLGIFPNETVKLLGKRMKDRLMGRPPRLLETQFKCKDGHWIWVAIEGKPMREEGIPVGFQIISTDITERKRAEEELRSLSEREAKSAREWQELFDASSDIIALISPDFEILRVNRAGYEGTGRKREELIGKICYEVVHGLHSPIDGCPCKELIRTKKAGVGEITQGGRYYIATASPVLDKNDELIAFAHIVKDITERKRMEEEIQWNYDIQTVINSILHLSLGNMPLEKLLNRTLQLILSIPWLVLQSRGSIFLVEDDPEVLVMKVQNGIAEPLRKACARVDFGRCLCGRAASTREIQFTNCLNDRHETRYEGITPHGHYCVPILSAGKVLGVINLYLKEGHRQDQREEEFLIAIANTLAGVIERKRMEEELKKAHEQLIRSEKLAAIGQLASGVGHELRDPLAAIKNAIFYVRRKIARSDLSASEPKVLEFLDIVDREVSSANKVISDLLAFSRVAKPTVSPVSIGSIIEDALEHVPVPENIKLTRDIGPSLPMVMVDADQIRQVFVNIILNAVEAMPEGGRLEIRAGSKAQFVEVEFADTGGGVPESIIDKIFDPLFTTKAKGIGLGLAMCKSILERHGGDIRVKSEKGKGAVFTASLPAQIV